MQRRCASDQPSTSWGIEFEEQGPINIQYKVCEHGTKDVPLSGTEVVAARRAPRGAKLVARSPASRDELGALKVLDIS